MLTVVCNFPWPLRRLHYHGMIGSTSFPLIAAVSCERLTLSPVSMSYIGDEPGGYWMLSKSHLHAATPQVQSSQLDS